MNYTQFKSEHGPKIQETILEFVNMYSSNAKLSESMSYSIKAGGKQFRPLLLLATLDFLNSPIYFSSYQVAASLEMIHTYSLIHDDLPAMDDDDLRRGMPTNHIKYGEATAILAGDGLLTEAFHLLSQIDLPPKQLIELIRLLCAASGSQGMISGQMQDICSENKRVEIEELVSIHEKKTGALIQYSMEAASVLAGCSDVTKEHLKTFGYHLGIAFQIMDDILDVIGDEETIGKPIGSDEKLQKSTYVSLLGLSGARAAFDSTYQQALESLEMARIEENIEQNDTILDQIIQELKEKK